MQLDPGPEAPPELRKTVDGTWSLHDKRLEVHWDKDLGATFAEPIALDVNEFKIKEDDPGAHGEWVTVHVDRQEQAVSFAFPLDAETTGTLTCRKA